MIEFAAVVVGVSIVVLVGYVVPTLLQVKRTIRQSEKMLTQINAELPTLLKELRGSTENVYNMTMQARHGVDRASVLFRAVGEVGESVRYVHGAIRGKSSALLMKGVTLLAGVRAATSIIKHRVHKGTGHE